jgi:hypothetical protein
MIFSIVDLGSQNNIWNNESLVRRFRNKDYLARMILARLSTYDADYMLLAVP